MRGTGKPISLAFLSYCCVFNDRFVIPDSLRGNIGFDFIAIAGDRGFCQRVAVVTLFILQVMLVPNKRVKAGLTCHPLRDVSGACFRSSRGICAVVCHDKPVVSLRLNMCSQADPPDPPRSDRRRNAAQRDRAFGCVPCAFGKKK